MRILLLHDLLRHRQADRHLRRHPTRAAAFFHPLRHLEFDVVVQISDRRHAGTFVDRLLDFRRDGDVLENEARQLDAVFRLDDRIDQWQERLAHFLITGRDIEHRNFRSRERVAEDADDARTHRLGEFIETKIAIRAGHFLEHQLRIDHLEIVGAKGAHAHDPEILIAHHDRIRSAPFVPGEKAGRDKINVRLEGRLEAVLPRLERGQNRDVVGREGVFARPESVAEFAQVNELRDLRFADDQLRAALDLGVVVSKRNEIVSRESSVHSMISISWPRMKFMMPMVVLLLRLFCGET